MSWFIYLLFCDNLTYYVGLTGNLPQRIKSHYQKQNIATKKFSNAELVYFERFKTRVEAEKREKQIYTNSSICLCYIKNQNENRNIKYL